MVGPLPYILDILTPLHIGEGVDMVFERLVAGKFGMYYT